MRLTKARKAILATLLAAFNKPDDGTSRAMATDGTPRYVFYTKDELADFAELIPSHIVANTAITDGSKTAYMLTAEGAAYAAKSTGGEAAASRAPIDVSGIELMEVEDFTKPEPKLRIRQSVYPFDKLAPPVQGQDGKMKTQGFFIKATEENPEPWKKLKGTVIAQNRRNKEKRAKDANLPAVEFTVTERTVNGTKGAYVCRTV